MQPDVETGADYAEADPGDNGDKSEDHVSGASTPVNENKKDENEDSGAASSKEKNLLVIIQELQAQIESLNGKLGNMEEKMEKDAVGQMKKVFDMLGKKDEDEKEVVPGDTIVKVKGFNPKDVPKPENRHGPQRI